MKAWRFYAGICGCLAILAGCTHDFGAFESGDESGGEDEGGQVTTDGGRSDASTTTDSGATTDSGVPFDSGSPCMLSGMCAGQAKTCADMCNTNEGMCRGKCAGPNKNACQADCADAGAQCTGDCVTTCVTCAGCNAMTACQTAAN